MDGFFDRLQARNSPKAGSNASFQAGRKARLFIASCHLRSYINSLLTRDPAAQVLFPLLALE